MPRDRQRLTLESGPKLDLAKLIPSGAGKPGSQIEAVGVWLTAGPIIPRKPANILSRVRAKALRWAAMVLGLLQNRVAGAGALQATRSYVLCPSPCLGRRAAYASQFLDPIGRAWRTKAKVKAVLLGDEDPDEWDIPPKPKGMRWATYERWVAKNDAAEDMLDAQLVMAAARLMKRL